MRSMTDVAINEAMDTAMHAVPPTLRMLRDALGLKNRALAAAMGKSLSWVQERTSGTTACKPGDLWGFAAVFEVDVDLLFCNDRNEVLRYLADHPSDQRLCAPGCLQTMAA